jgi:hypothetical protein
MKRVSYKTISYVIYPPNYVPGAYKYRVADTLRKAMRIARALGSGAELHRHVEVRNNHRHGRWYTEWYQVIL